VPNARIAAIASQLEALLRAVAEFIVPPVTWPDEELDEDEVRQEPLAAESR
jgi:hypothetical protein